MKKRVLRSAILYARVLPETKRNIKFLKPKDLSEAQFIEQILAAYCMRVIKRKLKNHNACKTN